MAETTQPGGILGALGSIPSTWSALTNWPNLSPAGPNSAPDQQNWNAIRKLLAQTAVGAAAVGGGIRGTQALYNMMQPDTPPAIDQTIKLKIPDEDEREAKAAAEPLDISTPFSKVFNDMAETLRAPETTRYGLGYAVPMAALPLGWTVVDRLMRSQKKQRLKSEVDEAKSEFDKAMMDQYSTKLASLIDKAYQAWESKQAVNLFGIDTAAIPQHIVNFAGEGLRGLRNAVPSPVSDAGLQLLSTAYVPYAAATALPAAWHGYQMAKSRLPASVLKRVRQLRDAKLADRPPMAIAVDDDDEEDREAE